MSDPFVKIGVILVLICLGIVAWEKLTGRWPPDQPKPVVVFTPEELARDPAYQETRRLQADEEARDAESKLLEIMRQHQDNPRD